MEMPLLPYVHRWSYQPQTGLLWFRVHWVERVPLLSDVTNPPVNNTQEGDRGRPPLRVHVSHDFHALSQLML